MKKFMCIEMNLRHPEKINNPISPIKKKPIWIRTKITNTQNYFKTKEIIDKKISLLTDRINVDYLETLYRQKFLVGKANEKIYVNSNESKTSRKN